ncbi:MAG: YceI family protein [Candidatus Latescibacterota bacterium]|nr:MAG: YceI family protein [Candidatus Latescibacterota bacterium]
MSHKQCLTVLLVCVLTLAAFSAAPAADQYTIDTSHSSILFSIKHLVITKVKGEFNEYAGTISYDDQDITKSSVEVTIKTASIDTKDEKRDAHLRTADFFDAEKYPEITFKSKRVVKSEDGFVVVGDLTMRGVTKEIEIPFVVSGVITDPWGNTRMGISAELKLNRQDYGISWSNKLDNGGLVVGNDVDIELEIEAIKAK